MRSPIPPPATNGRSLWRVPGIGLTFDILCTSVARGYQVRGARLPAASPRDDTRCAEHRQQYVSEAAEGSSRTMRRSGCRCGRPKATLTPVEAARRVGVTRSRASLPQPVVSLRRCTRSHAEARERREGKPPATVPGAELRAHLEHLVAQLGASPQSGHILASRCGFSHTQSLATLAAAGQDQGRIGRAIEFACTNNLVNIEAKQLDSRYLSG